MKMQHKNNSQSGFAIVEAIFTVVIIGVVIGGGIYLFQRKQAEQKTPDTAQVK
jgi:type II secretory pathway pseudopilin PulG